MKALHLLSLLTTSVLLLSACAPDSPEESQTLTPITTPVATIQPAATSSADPTATPQSSPSTKGKTMNDEKVIAQIQTDKGTIEVELYPDKAPATVKNFLDKAKSGFYTGLTFHRVEDWVIQGGDPDGNGTGGGKMPAEYNDVPFMDGSLGIARGMDKSQNNDSQFFICTADCGWLTNEYTNFGKVTKGMDVAKKISIGDKINAVSLK